MCKRNFPDKNEASTGCVRETLQKNKKNKNIKKISQLGMCKRNSPHTKNKASVGCVRETPQLKMKPARDM